MFCSVLFSDLVNQNVGRIDLYNPSGQPCNTAAACLDYLVYMDGTPFNAAVANHASVTFNIASGDKCIRLTLTMEFVGVACANDWFQITCKFDCFGSCKYLSKYCYSCYSTKCFIELYSHSGAPSFPTPIKALLF